MEPVLLVSNGAHESDAKVIEDNFPSHSGERCPLLDEVERILHSEELRGSGVLRRLLRFLAERSASGEADELKEYIVAIDGLGKPASYDPRHNSAVRIQVSRLRQKLAEYYRSEGIDDPVIVDIPKGRFKLKCEYRDGCAAAAHGAALAIRPEAAEGPHRKSFRERLGRMSIPASMAVGVLLALGMSAVYKAFRPAPAKASSTVQTTTWNAALEELWQPFIATNRPTFVAIVDPLFVEMYAGREVFVRDMRLNTWSEVNSSATVEALRRPLKNPKLAPSRHYTTFGEVDAAFLLARLLGARAQNLSVVKTSNLSLQEMAANNVVFVGVENRFFKEQIQAAPVEAPLQPVRLGIRDTHPEPNEPAVFRDRYSTAPTEDGMAYALVTHFPGPLGENDVETFASSTAAGYEAAVKAFTDPVSVQTLVNELKRSCGGRMPRYYQVLLKVQFTDELPTKITYVMARQLYYPGKS